MKLFQRMILALLCAPCVAHAQSGDISTTDLSNNYFRTGVGLAMGGAYRAVATGTQAVLYNPAGMKQNVGTMMINGEYNYFSQTEGHLFGVTVIDTQTSQDVAYGLSYLQDRTEVGGIGARNNQVMLSVANQAGAFYTGGSLKGYWINIDRSGLDGPKGVDLDLGLMFKPGQVFSLGIVGYNLIRGHKIEEYPLQAALAASISVIPQATFSVDLVKNYNTTSEDDVNLHFGGRILLNEQFGIRGGYAVDRVFGNDYYGVGLSVFAQQAQIHLAFGQTIDPQTEIYSISLEYRM